MRETLRRIQSKADGPRVSQASHARQPRQAGNRRSGVETRQTRQPPRDAGRPAWPAWARRAIFTPGGRDRLAEHQIQGFSQFPGAPGATGAASPRAGYSGRGSFLTQGRRGRAGLPTAALASLDGHGEPGRRTRRASVTPRAAGSGDAVAGRAGAPKGAPVCHSHLRKSHLCSHSWFARSSRFRSRSRSALRFHTASPATHREFRHRQ